MWNTTERLKADKVDERIKKKLYEKDEGKMYVQNVLQIYVS